MERFKKFVFKAEKGITFDISKGTNGELIIKARNIGKANENYANPPIPEGYEHICGKWNNGFTIERRSDGSQFVWIPVGILDYTGRLNETSFVEKFGRRIWGGNYDYFSHCEEDLTYELTLQFESVKKYGGFYISRFNISKNKKTGIPQSIKGEKPWTGMNFYEAQNIAATLENRESVKSHILYGAEYDTVLEWLIKSNARSYGEVVYNSSNWGNYDWKMNIKETGFKEEYSSNNIYDLAGNVFEWTQEQYRLDHDHRVAYNQDYHRIIRSGTKDQKNAAAGRCHVNPNKRYDNTGFHVALYIK